MWGIWPENIMCNVMRWHGANHLLKVTVVTEQHDVTNTQLWAYAAQSKRERWLLLSSSLIHPTQTWFPWQLTNLPSEWSHSVWPRGMTGYDKWRYSIRAITCYCTVWWLSLFSLCLSLLPSLSFLPPFFLTLSHIILLFLCTFFCLPPTHHPYVRSHYSQPFLPDTSACILCPCTSCLHLCFFLFFLSLSAAVLWWCSDLQPSLDRVRSASTTCLRPDTNFHSPDRDRYKKKTLDALHETSEFNLHKIVIFYFKD